MIEAAASFAAHHMLDRAHRFARWGQAREAAQAYRAACAGSLDTAARCSALLGLAGSLGALGDQEGAIDACRDAMRCAPDLSEPYAAFALASMHRGDLDAAAAAAREALARDDGAPELLCLAATIALKRGRAATAITATASILHREPGHVRALALHALAEWGSDEAVTRFELADLVRVSQPLTPTGFGSVAEFNSRLAQAIREDAALDPADAGSPLIGGHRLHDIFSVEPALARAVRGIFVEAAKDYARQRCAETLYRSRDALRAVAVRGWGNVMAAGAYETPHIHPDGWLSCVYYPALPEPGGEGGEIIFGPHDLGPGVAAPLPYRVKPMVGDMIVFPSYLYHSTAPHSSPGTRISVAADVVTVAG